MCIAHRSAPQTFIKTVNYNHIMPTRYTLDVDLKFVSPDVLEDATKKVETKKVSSLTLAVWCLHVAVGRG